MGRCCCPRRCRRATSPWPACTRRWRRLRWRPATGGRVMSDVSPGTILIVGDTEASRYAIGLVVRKAGYQVIEGSSGADALALAEQGPDLVILDINLPDLSGYDVCKRLKAGPRTAHTPVMHLSASFVGSDARAEGLEGGADGYLTYPT